jgi:hypothetical protein
MGWKTKQSSGGLDFSIPAVEIPIVDLRPGRPPSGHLEYKVDGDQSKV